MRVRTVTKDSGALQTATRTHRRWENRHSTGPIPDVARGVHHASRAEVPRTRELQPTELKNLSCSSVSTRRSRAAKVIEDPIPAAIRVKDRHVEDEHRAVPAARPAKPTPRSRDFSLVGICGFHLCVSLALLWHMRVVSFHCLVR
jgi:hypothetical protein